MSNKQNLAEELLENWQNNMQKAMQDPKISALMLDNVNQMKILLSNYEKSIQQNSRAEFNDNNGNTQHDELVKRIDAIEARLSILEKYLARSTK